MEVWCVMCCILILLILYKLLDRLIRIPYIGRYGERYIFVTGCDTGFGHELVKRLDRLGCHVYAGCLTEKGETELNKICSDRLHTIPLDVSKHESVLKAFELVKSKIPEGRGLWAVVNNAGIGGPVSRIEWLSLSDYKATIDVNLFGLIDVSTTFLPLVKQERGRIVNTSSMAGRFSSDIMVPYAVSKYGVEAFSDGLRRSLRVFGCKAILIEPGSFNTGILTVENIRRNVESMWSRADPGVQQQFGNDYRDFYLNSFPQACCSMSSDNIGEVVDAYQHALLGRFPRARYVLGKDALYFIRVMEKLPEWIPDLFLDKCLDTKRPLPACLLKKKPQ